MDGKRVDKGAKTFGVADEFIMHTFTAHLISSICELLGIHSTTDPIPHENSKGWLQSAAKSLAAKTLAPCESTDPLYAFHRSFLSTCFLYVDLRTSIR